MPILGFRDLASAQRLHPLWDLESMKKIELASGKTADAMLADVQTGLNIKNGEILSHPYYSGLFSITDEVFVESAVGGSRGVVEITDRTVMDPGGGNTTGHSVPIKTWGRAIGWSFMGLQKASQRKLDADVTAVMSDLGTHPQFRILRRFFLMAAEDVGDTSNASLPLANGTANTTKYIPMPNGEGKVFLNTHDHFLRVPTLNVSAVDAAINHLEEHGHKAPWDITASSNATDIAAWQAMANWRPPTFSEIHYMSLSTDRAKLSTTDFVQGFYEHAKGIARVWFNDRVPTNYFGVHKNYGVGSQMNPVRYRIDPITGFGYKIMPGQWLNQPQIYAAVATEYDAGIGEDRTNGVLTFVAGSGDYIDPVIGEG